MIINARIFQVFREIVPFFITRVHKKNVRNLVNRFLTVIYLHILGLIAIDRIKDLFREIFGEKL